MPGNDAMKRVRAALAGAALLALSGPWAVAAEYSLELVRVTSGSANGMSNAVSLTTIGSWVYDDSAGTVKLSGTQRNRFDLSPAPNNDLFTHVMADVVFDLDAVTISGAAYECVEGDFGSLVGASLCGNVNFGENFIPETTLDYGAVPGTRAVGGDDVALGPQQQLTNYAAGLNTFNGSVLLIESPDWTANPGSAGLQLEFLVNDAPPLLDVPDVRGQDQALAEAAIAAGGLAVGTVSAANDPFVPAGRVLSQNPLPCDGCAMLNDAVDLVVSLGPVPVVTLAERIDALGAAVDDLDLLRSRKVRLHSELASAAYVLAICSDGNDVASAKPWAARLRQRLATLSQRPAVWVERLSRRLCLDDGGARRAAQHVEDFIGLVDTYRGRSLATEDADELVAQARVLIAEILFVPPSSGLVSISSGGAERVYYLRMPSDYSRFDTPKPILFAFHGTNGTWMSWFEGGYYGPTLQETIGDGAIMVFMQAETLVTGIRQWDFATDFEYFQDVLADVANKVRFDTNRIFVTGHSSGGGFTHEIGCRFGDIVRAIAPHSGALTGRDCTGAVAVMQLQSENDELVPASAVTPARDFWVLYNGFDLDASGPGTAPACRDYSLGSSLYPVEWCLHDESAGEGHAWWSQASASLWTFFSGLPTATPSADPPPGGGLDRVLEAFPARLDFTVRFPETIGEVELLVAVLYPPGTRPPLRDSPLWFLNLDIDPGAAAPGTEQSYSVPIQLFDSTPETPLPGTYTLGIVAYVEGGTFPIPAAGIDQNALVDIEIVDRFSTIVVGETLQLLPIVSE